MKIPEDVAEMLEKETSIKMIGTVDADLCINIEHLKVIKIIDYDTIHIPHFTDNDRTFDNLQKNKKVSIAVFEPAIIAFKLNGLFAGVKKTEESLKHFSGFFDAEKLAGAINIKITEIYALTMAIAGDKVA